ncbi:hypothetical protein Taro_030613 [Colocasia esculenta]|uniref:Uncharacterized protein n=1 Tax=Colocasia esculenta TaxID=4460 RepID=A0A843VWL7_COLES|nr:hypothetical protein [Colocasia esculenta]
MLPSPVWYVCGLWAALGWSIPWVCLSTGVATAVRVATPEEAVCCHDALPRRDRVAVAVPFPVTMVSRRPRGTQQYLCCLRCFCGSGWSVGVCPRASLPLGPSGGERDRLPHCVQLLKMTPSWLRPGSSARMVTFV